MQVAPLGHGGREESEAGTLEEEDEDEDRDGDGDEDEDKDEDSLLCCSLLGDWTAGDFLSEGASCWRVFLGC